jgi:LmbE family N-acetylglucosaminyl deacetylase
VVGATEHHWLDLPDGGCEGLDPSGPVQWLAALVDEIRPDTVITFGPDGFTGHPDHRAVSAWTDAGLRDASYRDARLLHAVTQEDVIDREIVDRFGVYVLGEPRICTDDELAIRLALAGTALDRKVEALIAQTSQTAALVDALGLERFSAWVATECFAAPR